MIRRQRVLRRSSGVAGGDAQTPIRSNAGGVAAAEDTGRMAIKALLSSCLAADGAGGGACGAGAAPALHIHGATTGECEEAASDALFLQHGDLAA